MPSEGEQRVEAIAEDQDLYIDLEADACRELWASVFRTAIHDLAVGTFIEKKVTKMWLRSEGFVEICGWLDLDSDKVREMIWRECKKQLTP
jgi:hypothetical protein